MTADIVFSLMLSQLSELIPHTKRITSETFPKPLSAVPQIIENTKKSSVALPQNLSSGLSASRSWLIVMIFQVSAPPQALPTHQNYLRYDFRITVVRQLEMKRRKEEIILRKKIGIGLLSYVSDTI